VHAACCGILCERGDGPMRCDEACDAPDLVVRACRCTATRSGIVTPRQRQASSDRENSDASLTTRCQWCSGREREEFASVRLSSGNWHSAILARLKILAQHLTRQRPEARAGE
jgi:hypothetical protein